MNSIADGRTGPTRLRSAVGQVRVAKGSDVMAETLRARILDGTIEAGVLLPTERELVDESGLSRASVREALRALTVEGLVSPKVGRHGGYVVQQPPREAIIRSLDGFIRGRRVHRRSLLEVREMIEPVCAALAAERRSEGELQQLKALTTEMAELTEDVPAFLDRNIDWHVAVADASQNEILASLMTAISTNIRSQIALEEYDSPDMMRSAQRLHEGVVAAIAEQDPIAAHRRMARHLHATSEVVLPSRELPIRPENASRPTAAQSLRSERTPSKSTGGRQRKNAGTKKKAD